jgi:hypothetical protein
VGAVARVTNTLSLTVKIKLSSLSPALSRRAFVPPNSVEPGQLKTLVWKRAHFREFSVDTRTVFSHLARAQLGWELQSVSSTIR